MAENQTVSAINHDVSAAIRNVIARDLKNCTLSRDEVAARISAMAGRNITRSQLDAYIASSKPHRFPLDLVSAWVHITGSTSLLTLICSGVGLYVADETEHKLADFGRSVLAREKLSAREADLKAALMERI